MLSFAPFDEEKVEVDVVSTEPPAKIEEASKCPMSFLYNFGDCDTECNMIVMLFVASVVVLAVSDLMRK